MDATTNKVEKVDQMLPIGDLVLLGIQHIAAMCAGAMAVPIILGNILGLDSVQINHLVSASFMMAGLRNYDTNTRDKKLYRISRLPMVEGVSFCWSRSTFSYWINL